MWRPSILSFLMPSQHKSPDMAHQQWGDAWFPKTRHLTMNSLPSILTTWCNWKMGWASKLRKADATSDLKVTRHFPGFAVRASWSIWPKVLMSSYLTLASEWGMLLLIPEWEWSVTTHGFSFCQTMNIGKTFIPGKRLVFSKDPDQCPAVISQSQ